MEERLDLHRHYSKQTSELSQLQNKKFEFTHNCFPHRLLYEQNVHSSMKCQIVTDTCKNNVSKIFWKPFKSPLSLSK